MKQGVLRSKVSVNISDRNNLNYNRVQELENTIPKYDRKPKMMQKGNIKMKVDKWHTATRWVMASTTLKVVRSVKVSHSVMEEKGIRSATFALSLRTNLFLGPSGQAAVALDGEAVATVSASKATNTGAQAAEGALLRALRRLHRLVERSLGEHWQADRTGVLSAGVQVRRSQKTANGRGARLAGGSVDEAKARGALVTTVGGVGLRRWVEVCTVESRLRRRVSLLLLLLGLLLLLKAYFCLLLLLLVLLSLEVHHQRVVHTRIQDGGRSRCLDVGELSVGASTRDRSGRSSRRHGWTGVVAVRVKATGRRWRLNAIASRVLGLTLVVIHLTRWVTTAVLAKVDLEPLVLLTSSHSFDGLDGIGDIGEVYERTALLAQGVYQFNLAVLGEVLSQTLLGPRLVQVSDVHIARCTTADS